MARQDVSIRSILGSSQAMEKVRAFARTAAVVNVPVLILGETGTGKSHLGRVIHFEGVRAGGPLVAVNCAGIPETLFESEFFGHTRGAFTGAREGRKGLLEQAQGGSLILDEVGELTVGQQAKLLTALEDGEVRRLGGESATRVDVRIMSATARNLSRELAKGGFRRDLFYRVAVLTCWLPPLRDRREDISPLAEKLLRVHQGRHGFPREPLSQTTLEFLRGQDWPGNVRELSHVLEASLILSHGGPIEPEALREAVGTVADPQGHETAGRAVCVCSRGEGDSEGRTPTCPGRPGQGKAPPDRYFFPGTEGEERTLIEAALGRAGGNKSRAARELGMARNTLHQKLSKYGLGIRCPKASEPLVPGDGIDG